MVELLDVNQSIKEKIALKMDVTFDADVHPSASTSQLKMDSTFYTDTFPSASTSR